MEKKIEEQGESSPAQGKIERLEGNVNRLHGRLGQQDWLGPRLAARSAVPNRADQGNKTLAHEYLDEPEVLAAKVKIMADLIRKAKCCVAYTGAGLSKAAGIPDYASKAKDSLVQVKKVESSLDCQPTYSHHALAAMERKGFLHHYVQQNHDGLPQKAGYPQEKINEIHGAWFDPSNPVVKFSGSLRDDLFQWLLEMEDKTDLCLCLGTSLSGMNADRMAETPAKRFCKGQKDILGTIVINLQQTRLDDVSSVRIWAKLDDVFRQLNDILALGLAENPVKPDLIKGDVFWVPYNAEGVLDQKIRMKLDLSRDAKIKICQEGSNYKKNGYVKGKDHDGNWKVGVRGAKVVKIYRLGRWWVDKAMKGEIAKLPLVNEEPETKPVEKEEGDTEGKKKKEGKKKACSKVAS